MRRRVKKSGQSRFWKKPLIAMAAIALLGALLLAATVHYFLKSSELERGLEKITGQVLRADVSIKPWEWNGAWFSSDALTLRGWEDSHFKNAEGFHVRLGWNWRALFSGVFQLEEISIDEVQAEFQSPSKSQSSRKNDVFIPLPLRFQLDRIVIGRVRILYQNVSANGLKLLLTPQANGELKISGSGGVLHVPNSH
jgi:autotransporter translocation and assembly factor TamB